MALRSLSANVGWGESPSGRIHKMLGLRPSLRSLSAQQQPIHGQTDVLGNLTEQERR